jgi:hypothetical protein
MNCVRPGYESTTMKIFIALALILSLSACGADVATGAATAAKARAEEIKGAQKTKEHIINQLNAAMAEDQKRLHDADQAIR